MNSIQTMVAQWRQVYDERKELERLAEEIKKGPEAEAKAAIMTYLDANGQDSLKLSGGGGTVSKRVTTSIRMSNAEQACQVMFERMKAAEAEGRPLLDELMFQQTPLKSYVMETAEEALTAAGRPVDFAGIKEVAEGLGFTAYASVDLGYTKR